MSLISYGVRHFPRRTIVHAASREGSAEGRAGDQNRGVDRGQYCPSKKIQKKVVLVSRDQRGRCRTTRKPGALCGTGGFWVCAECCHIVKPDADVRHAGRQARPVDIWGLGSMALLVEVPLSTHANCVIVRFLHETGCMHWFWEGPQ